ncbi:MAG: EVE domain-containing protein [Acidobacteriota bacterium]|nr:EVE domain-containing protein [Acidobacteriota bacterium]
MPSYWLVKSEPDVYSLDDLEKERGGSATWEGVRNYEARNFLRAMKRRDKVLFYHSRVKEPAIVGVATVARESYPDPTQFEPASDYFDPGSDPEDPRWSMVDLRFSLRFVRPVTRAELKRTAGLEEMPLLARGNRLSVTPVTPGQWAIIARLGKRRA